MSSYYESITDITQTTIQNDGIIYYYELCMCNINFFLLKKYLDLKDLAKRRKKNKKPKVDDKHK